MNTRRIVISKDNTKAVELFKKISNHKKEMAKKAENLPIVKELLKTLAK